MGKKSGNNKDSSVVGLTEQLFLLDEMKEQQFCKDLKALKRKLTKRLNKAVVKTSNVLTERNSTTGFELTAVIDPWSTYVALDPAMNGYACVYIPGTYLATVSSDFFIGETTVLLVPESQSLALPVSDHDDQFVMVDADQVVELFVMRQLFEQEQRLPTGGVVNWIIEWLDDLRKDPTVDTKVTDNTH